MEALVSADGLNVPKRMLKGMRRVHIEKSQGRHYHHARQDRCGPFAGARQCTVVPDAAYRLQET